METVLYYIMECKDLIVSFLILMFILAIICYLAIRNFEQTKRSKVIIYGLFSRMNTIDTLKFSTVFIKTFLVFYSIITLEQTKIYVSIFMIIALTIIYMILSPKRLIYETMGTLFYVAMIYFIYTLNNYYDVVENSKELLMIRIVLISFLFVLSGYLFFKEIYIIPEDRELKNRKKEEKSNKKMEET